MLKKIIEINEEKCIGCGLCANACHQSAIEIIDGKAKLIDESFCDGLGMCLPECPQNAIQLIEKEKAPIKEITKKEKLSGGGCPGMRSATFNREETKQKVQNQEEIKNVNMPSQLNQWPVQIDLISPFAEYLKHADLLIAADCTAYAYANIHNEFIKGRITLIGCPKLDDNQGYKEKLIQILSNNDVKSITVLRMEVPCCSGIVASVREAMLESKTIVPYDEVIIGIDGEKR
ncbi:4Fe-4S binding protein [Natranaerovirga hydrolytica]|uniref:4Fe-4S binding protein n=1 Tax=Natranaerovirga hydrolytica TaxID=680378 RepID=A0A4R1MX46_9FIRM|nr:4Fe-4S binding protein [Natranaerovirga hydrolytica]TCK97828.1 4Fe-4S binding protein [Natranaerovirga hydrolytica]